MTRSAVAVLAAFLTSWVVLGVGQQVHGQQTDAEAYLRNAIVVDANGVPLSGVKVYDRAYFAWDDRAAVARWVPKEPSHQTDPNGEFSFDVGALGGGPTFFIANDSRDLMGYLRGSRKDPMGTRTVRLESPARIRAVFRSEHVAMDRPSLQIGFYESEKRTIHSNFITVVYGFEGPVPEVPLDVICPSGCSLYLMMSAGGGILPISREIASLKPGEVLNLGSIEPHLKSGYKAIGRQAPALRVAEWVRGNPVTLAELKGKVVLLEFWGVWCAPGRESMERLASLHQKYGKDGLVIIAIHDSSQTGASLLSQGDGLPDQSKVPFRIAVDSPMEGEVICEKNRGKGQTIDAYGITRFPTTLIINRDGKVEDTEQSVLEDRLYLLLHGQPMPKPTGVSRMVTANRRLFIQAGVAVAMILLLMIVLAVVWLR